MDYGTLIIRTVLFYILILLSLRLLGKREVGNLSVFDVVVFLLIAEVSSDSIHSLDESMWKGIVPVAVLAFVQLTMAYVTLKSKRFRDIVEGEPALVIRDGVIQEQVMRKHRYNLDDLLQQLREQQIGSIQEIDYAFLESSGRLSVFEKGKSSLFLGVIMDGEIQHRHLLVSGHTEEELLEKLAEQGIAHPDSVFYAVFADRELHVQLKSTSQTL